MTYMRIGAGFYTNYFQGDTAGKSQVPGPRDGDTYLDTDDGKLYTYMKGKWNPVGGA